jgi:hypothetical protein
VLSPSSTASTAHPATYVPLATDTLKLIFRDHFHAFSDAYDSLCARGIARIQCSNPAFRFAYFRPFSCEGFYPCPSCSQKRTLLFAEYLDEQLLLTLPHRQFVFSIPSGGSPSAPKARGGESPKALRIFFRHDQKLFAAVSSLIFSLIRQFYRLAAGSPPVWPQQQSLHFNPSAISYELTPIGKPWFWKGVSHPTADSSSCPFTTPNSSPKPSAAP